MKPINAGGCRVHVLVCTNERPQGQMCCQRSFGPELFQRLKTKVAEQGLQSTHWITRTGCLGFCSDSGATVTIYPKGQGPRWYSEVSDADFDFLWQEIVRQ